MRWSELAGKDIINVEDANRLGRVEQADLILDEDGAIVSLVTGVRGRRRGRPELEIPWERVVRIGPQAMLVSFEPGDGERPGRRTIFRRSRDGDRDGERAAHLSSFRHSSRGREGSTADFRGGGQEEDGPGAPTERPSGHGDGETPLVRVVRRANEPGDA